MTYLGTLHETKPVPFEDRKDLHLHVMDMDGYEVKLYSVTKSLLPRWIANIMAYHERTGRWPINGAQCIALKPPCSQRNNSAQ